MVRKLSYSERVAESKKRINKARSMKKNDRLQALMAYDNAWFSYCFEDKPHPKELGMKEPIGWTPKHGIKEIYERD